MGRFLLYTVSCLYKGKIPLFGGTRGIEYRVFDYGCPAPFDASKPPKMASTPYSVLRMRMRLLCQPLNSYLLYRRAATSPCALAF